MLRFLTATFSAPPEIYRYKRRAREHLETERGLYSISITHSGDCFKKITRQLETAPCSPWPLHSLVESSDS